MIEIYKFNFFVGVPDSGLEKISKQIEVSNKEHIIACNEGHAVGIAFGAILAAN